MIPKIIHYCWFGGEKPADVKEYIDGWRKLCPDFEIIEWNEKNFDINAYDYSRDAYKEKKWAFVSDFVRFCVLDEHGGIYLDTDVELVKSLEPLCSEKCYVGYEAQGVGSAIIACEPHNEIIHAITETYKKSSFYLPDGSLNLLTSPDYINNEITPKGFEREDKLQRIPGLTVFPSEWFYPYNLKTFTIESTSNTVSIHHFAGSWLDEKAIIQLEIQKHFKWFPVRRLVIWFSVAVAELKTGGITGLLRAIKRRKNRDSVS